MVRTEGHSAATQHHHADFDNKKCPRLAIKSSYTYPSWLMRCLLGQIFSFLLLDRHFLYKICDGIPIAENSIKLIFENPDIEQGGRLWSDELLT